MAKRTYLFRRFICSVLIVIAVLIGGIPAAVGQDNAEQELFLVAQKAFEDGFYDVAMRYINQLFEEYPRSDKTVQAKLLLGQCYFFKLQYLKAYDVFSELSTYSDYKDATLYWLGETYLKGFDYAKAIKQYNQLIDLYPDSEYAPQARYSLGWSYFAQGDYKEAKKAFSTMVRKFPVHQLAEDGIAVTSRVTGAGSPEFRADIRGLLSGGASYLIGKGHGFFALGKTFDEAGLLALRFRTEATGLMLGKKVIEELKRKYEIC